MTHEDFQRDFLKLVNQTDVVITAANIAYHLNIAIEEAQEQLIALELNGTIHEVTDTDGNVHYEMPNRSRPGTFPAKLDDVSQSTRTVLSTQSNIPSVHRPASGNAVNGLVLNTFLPGIGSLVCGKTSGLWLTGGTILGLVLISMLRGPSVVGGLMLIFGCWAASVIQGIQLLADQIKNK